MRGLLVALALVLGACSKGGVVSAAPDAGAFSAGAASMQVPPGFVYEADAVMKILDGLRRQNPTAQAAARSWLNPAAQMRLTLTSVASPHHKQPGAQALRQTLDRTIAGMQAQGLTLEPPQIDQSPEQVSYLISGAAGQSAITTRGILAFDREGALRNWAVTCSVPIEKRADCAGPVATFSVDLTQTPLQTFAPQPAP